MNPFLKVIQLYKSETQLIKAAAKNNSEAQRNLFEMHAPKMLSVCRYYVKDVHQAEEVMHNGFLKVFTKLESFNNVGSFEGWIRRIMVRESISYLRKQNTIEFSTHEIEGYDQQINSITNEFEVEQIQELIDNLPEGYRMVFVMYAIEGYKHFEIAKMLNIKEGTSKSQLFKARKMLQQRIGNLNKRHNGTD